MNKKVSEAQVKASRAWEERNKEKARHDTARRQARRYVNNFANLEDIEELKGWVVDREKVLKDKELEQ